MKPVEVNVNFLYHLETSESHIFFIFLGSTKGNTEPKWVKQQQQHWREWHSFMLLA